MNKIAPIFIGTVLTGAIIFIICAVTHIWFLNEQINKNNQEIEKHKVTEYLMRESMSNNSKY